MANTHTYMIPDWQAQTHLEGAQALLNRSNSLNQNPYELIGMLKDMIQTSINILKTAKRTKEERYYQDNMTRYYNETNHIIMERFRRDIAHD